MCWYLGIWQTEKELDIVILLDKQLHKEHRLLMTMARCLLFRLYLLHILTIKVRWPLIFPLVEFGEPEIIPSLLLLRQNLVFLAFNIALLIPSLLDQLAEGHSTLRTLNFLPHLLHVNLITREWFLRCYDYGLAFHWLWILN